MNDKDKKAFEEFMGENLPFSYYQQYSCPDIDAWQAACEYKQEEIDEYKEAARSEAALVNELQAENAKLRELARMVENNSLMPHKHEDYYARLCCLSERANEVLKELGEK